MRQENQITVQLFKLYTMEIHYLEIVYPSYLMRDLETESSKADTAKFKANVRLIIFFLSQNINP
jgi:hypothetical protein